MPWRWFLHVAAAVAVACVAYFILLVFWGTFAGWLLSLVEDWSDGASWPYMETGLLFLLSFLAAFATVTAVSFQFRGVPAEFVAGGLTLVLIVFTLFIPNHIPNNSLRIAYLMVFVAVSAGGGWLGFAQVRNIQRRMVVRKN